MSELPTTEQGRAFVRGWKYIVVAADPSHLIRAIEDEARGSDSQMTDLIAACAERNIYSRGDLELHERIIEREALAQGEVPA